MDQDAITLFHELADRSPAERAEYYAQHQVPEAVRAEVESLLQFDGPAGPSLGAYLASAAEQVLLQGDGVPETIAHYRITSMLGEGGMGKVYRAIDTKLGREVAIKVIPEGFAQDAGRMARFTREAKVLASLNHPNIAAIYGVEDRALVMELVEGPTLAERIARGAVPLAEALEIARQMADALEAAHEKGIVHRDLKPANVKINPDGIVKVLDFGLAVTQTSAVDSSSPENSPTLTRRTEAGIILGTAAYMSPEQARGKPVDKRTDIWAFGVVLYEMLTGRRLFDGETVPDILVAVLNAEPDWSQVGGKVQRLLTACLEKDPKRRLQAIGDARLLLEDPPEIPLPRARSWLAWAGVTAVCTVLAAIGWLRPQTSGGAAPNVAFTIVPPPRSDTVIGFNRMAPVISPNGALIHWRGRNGLELRRLNSIHPETVRGTEGASDLSFWSPDSTSIAFPTHSALLRVRLPDGIPELITRLTYLRCGGTWSERGTILFSNSLESTLSMVSAAGGEARQIEVPGLKDGIFFGPEFLPGGEDFLVLFISYVSEDAGVYLVTLRAGKPADPVLLLKNETAAHYSPASGGRIFFVRSDNLYAQKLDVKGRRIQGAPELVERGVASDPWFGEAHFSVSQSGVVAWRPGRAALSQVTIFDRSGKTIGSAGPPDTFNYVRLSPDGTRLLATGATGSRLLEPGRPGIFALGRGQWWNFWSPDGLRLIGQNVPGDILERMAGGAAATRQLMPSFASVLDLEDMSPDGKLILYRNQDGSISSRRLDGSAQERAPRSVVQTNELINTSRFSPDGRWIAYYAHSQQDQNLGIYVQPFPGPGLRKQIANDGRYPVWSKDGKEILYFGLTGRIWSVSVNAAAGELRFGAPQPLFSVRPPPNMVSILSPLDVSRDGSRIYFAQGVEQPDADLIHVKMGWQSAGPK